MFVWVVTSSLINESKICTHFEANVTVGHVPQGMVTLTVNLLEEL